jgi:MFS family permease
VAGQTLSLLGINMSAVALPWYVLTTTGSPGRMAIVLFAQTLPYAIVGLPAGVMVDRVDQKKLMVLLDTGRGAAIGLIPALAWFGVLEFWMIVGLAFLGGLLAAPYQGARLAIVPGVVGEDEAELARANTLLQGGMYGASIAGPVIAGLLIPVVGNGAVIAIDAMSYWVAAMILGFGMSHVPRVETGIPRLNVWREMREGISYALGHPYVRLALLLGGLAGLGFWLILDAALPVFTRDVLARGPEALGWLVGVWGVGAALGMALFGMLDRHVRARRVVKLATTLTLMALALTIAPATGAYVPALVGLFIAGVFDGPSGVMVQTILQHRTPKRLRGRVSTAFYAVSHTVAPVGLLAAGPVLERWGAIPIMWAVAFTFGLCALAAWRLAVGGVAEAEPEFAR